MQDQSDNDTGDVALGSQAELFSAPLERRPSQFLPVRCAECGAPFDRPLGISGSPLKLCGPRCASVMQLRQIKNGHDRLSKLRRARVPTFPARCVTCRKVFMGPSGARFCSGDCKRAYGFRELMNKRFPRCAQCGDIFELKTFGRLGRRAKFCDDRCRSLAKRKGRRP